MGVDTKAYIPNINRDNLVEFISQVGKFRSLEDSAWKEYKTINFEYKNENRTLHTHDLNLKTSFIKNKAQKKGYSFEGSDEYMYIHDHKLPAETKGLLLSFRLWGKSIEIMKMICFRFGGYLDESDSDDEDFYKIDKDPKKIFHLIFE